MAMNVNIMGDAIMAAVNAVDPTDRQALFRAMAGAIIAHIQANASISGVVTGLTSATGGIVSGTGTLPAGSID